jgi:hypothetical protein
VFGFAPRLYEWFVQERLRKLYRRLRVVEKAMQVELTVPQAEALQSDLVDIDRLASAVSMRHSDLYFIFRYHLDQTRSRLAEAQKRKLKSVVRFWSLADIPRSSSHVRFTPESGHSADLDQVLVRQWPAGKLSELAANREGS